VVLLLAQLSISLLFNEIPLPSPPLPVLLFHEQTIDSVRFHFLVIMEKGGAEGSKVTSTRRQVDNTVFPNRLVEIADVYSDDPIVKWFVLPFVRHFFK
jgi:hypothetical protein